MINRLVSLTKSKLVQDTGLYTLFNLIDRSIPFLLLPVVTRFLDPAEYGMYVTFQSLTMFLMPFVTMNSDAAIIRNYFNQDVVDFKSYFSNGLIVFAFFTFLSFLVIIATAPVLSVALNFPSPWLVAVVFVSALQFASDLFLNLLQAKKLPRTFGAYRIALTLSRNSLMIFFVVSLGWKWEGIIYSQIIVFFLFFIVSFYHFYREGYLFHRFNKHFTVDNIRYGAPLTLHRIGAWLTDLSSRIILTSLLGAAATGKYSIGASLGMIVALAQDSFNRAFVPYLYEQLNAITDRTKDKLVRLTYLYHVAILLLALFIGFGGYFAVGTVFGEKYEEAAPYIIWIAVGYAFDGMYKMHVNYIFYASKTHYIFPITVTSGIVNVILCYLFIPIFGAIGAAQALCGGLFVSFVLAWIVGNKIYPMPWHHNVFAFRGTTQ